MCVCVCVRGDVYVLYPEGNQGESNHQQIQQIKVISAESSFVKESAKRSHLMNTTKTSELNCFLIVFITFRFNRNSNQSKWFGLYIPVQLYNVTVCKGGEDSNAINV